MIHALAPVAAGGGAWPWALPGEAAAEAWLDGLGLPPGGRLALGGLNRPGTAQVLAAALRRGLTVIPFNRRLAPAELARQLADAAADRAAADPDHPLAAVAACAPLPPGFAGGPGGGGPCRGALVLFTSGTTGRPRAARLPAEAISAAIAAHATALGLSRDDAWFLPLPLDHVGGAMGVLRALATGCRLLVAERFDADEGGRALADATGASLVPTMLARLIAARGDRRWPPGLRRLLVGGGPLPAGLAAAAADLGLAPQETYGLTEMGSMVALDGRPVPTAQVQVVTGRILVDGPMRFAGYEERGVLAPSAGWHATGDLGAIGGDGRLRIAGRLAELIVSGGENVSAPEVEAALGEHPAVADACVVGLPDPEWGEAVAAAVVLRGAVPTATLAAHCAGRLAGYKRPRRWLVLDALPRTALGKLRREEVRAMFAGGSPG